MSRSRWSASARTCAIGAMLAACTSPAATTRPGATERATGPAWFETLEPDESAPATIALGKLVEEERTIGLREVLHLVRTQGLDIQIARERLRTARADADIAESAWWPQLSLGTTMYRNEGRVQSTEGLFLDVDKQNAWVGAELWLELDVGDAIFGARAARRNAEADEFATHSTEFDALTLGAFAYFDLLESFARLPIAAEALAHADSLVDFARARREAGAGLESDLARARAHRAATQRATIQARTRAQLASATLVELIQLDPGTSIAPSAGGLVALALVPENLRPEGGTASAAALTRAMLARPELREADARVAARDAEADRADNAWLLPEVLIGAQTGALGYNFDDLESQDVYIAAVRWNLGVHLVGERARGHSHRRQARLERARTRSTVAREVQASAAEYEASQRSIEAIETEVEAATAARALAQARYEQGAALLIEVLDSQVQLLRAQVARAGALADFNRAQFAYLRAVGALADDGTSR